MLGRLKVTERGSRQNSLTTNGVRYVGCSVEKVKSRIVEDFVQSGTSGPAFGGALSLQTESPDYSLHRAGGSVATDRNGKGLVHTRPEPGGVYRVPGQASRMRDIMQLANSGVPLLLTEMVKALRIRGLSLEGIYRVPGRASRMRDIMQLANSEADVREREWRWATLDFVLHHLREVVALQASNRMSARALSLCLTPSLFGTTENAETNSRVLELLIEHWPWLSSGLHQGSQTVSAIGLGQPYSEACLYACRSSSNRPERRTALVTRELARYKLDIAALSETRFSEQGKLV
ncbi:unnamed protein product [Schistocephalus solidus]|uniref:Rho-GAP domain-containing protein n=1 Tax=Schistocephalus solidus TaxID=70667 RepID=A0A183SSC0_SCHSO|nr:unnamed protein product [Schistocephalus solidus]